MLYLALGLPLALALLLFVAQRSLIYFPRPYAPGAAEAAARLGTQALAFTVDGHAQTAWYLPAHAEADGLPRTVWVVLGGNAMVALDWLTWMRERLPEEDAALLVDYPGYGLSEGKPTRTSIARSLEGAFTALAGSLGIPPEELEGRISILGHSLGCAAGLEFAITHQPQRMVLAAPFTSLHDMARLQVGPLAHLLRDRYDNAARLRELAETTPRPEIIIVHGRSDSIVPVRMSRQLAEEFAGWIVLHVVPDASHNDLFTVADRELTAALRGEPLD